MAFLVAIQALPGLGIGYSEFDQQGLHQDVTPQMGNPDYYPTTSSNPPVWTRFLVVNHKAHPGCQVKTYRSTNAEASTGQKHYGTDAARQVFRPLDGRSVPGLPPVGTAL
jgi:hypothetical protein